VAGIKEAHHFVNKSTIWDIPFEIQRIQIWSLREWLEGLESLQLTCHQRRTKPKGQEELTPKGELKFKS